MIKEEILLKFKERVLKIEEFNATHGNLYIDGLNYILADQAIKILEDIMKEIET